MLGDLRVDQLTSMRLEPLKRALFVGADQTRVTRDIRSENGGESTVHGSPAPERTTVWQSYAVSINQHVHHWEGRRRNRHCMASPLLAMQRLSSMPRQSR